MSTKALFSPYQKFIIAILAMLQFTVILDFMVLSPLGAILMPKLKITTAQFGYVVSGYAFSAGISGLLAAGFADKFDRKKLLMFFYVGFLIGTLLCAMAESYEFLLFARILTGIFGGVIGSIGFAIILDLFKAEVRGRVMGFTQMAFGASQVLGLPIGLYLANHLGWHSPFYLIVAFGVFLGLAIWFKMEPITEHLKFTREHNALQHVGKTLSNPLYIRGFLSTVLLATGGFMLMPFGSAFSVNNLGLTMEQIPLMYFITGIFSIVLGPYIGKLVDKTGSLNLFIGGSILSIITILIYCNLGITPFWICCVISVVMFTGINARMIAANTLTARVPSAQDRGSFMSINSSIMQISGGISTFIAGLVVVQEPNGHLGRYPLLGWIVVMLMVIAIGLIYYLDQYLKKISS